MNTKNAKKWKRSYCVISVLTLLSMTLSGCGTVKETGADSDATTIKVFAPFTQLSEERNTVWIDYAKEKLNIKLDFETPPDSSYKERLQIMLVSGDYPDVVLFLDHNDLEFKNAVSGGVVVPVNQHLEKAENILKYSYPSDFDALKINGDENIYGIPRTSVLRGDGYIVRKDWLDKVGLDIEPNSAVTQEQFEEILRRFTFNDPDGNGKKDTYGITTFSSMTSGMNLAVSQPYKIYGWQEKPEGNYKYMDARFSREDDEYKKAMEYNARLFREGLINPDSPVLSTETMAFDKFRQSISGVSVRFAGHARSAQLELKKVNPDAEVIYLQGISNEDGNVRVGNVALNNMGIGFWGLWGITKANKHPEKIVELFDWMLSDGVWETVTTHGIEGVNHVVENGQIIGISGQGAGISRSFVRRSGDVGFFMSSSASLEEFSLEERAQVEVNIRSAIDNFVMPLDRGFMPSVTQTSDFINYQTKMAEGITKILIGDSPVSEYDNLLDGWYKAGGEEYVKEMNEYIERMEK